MPSKFFIQKGGKTYGPVSSSDLMKLAQSGKLAPADLVWKEGNERKVPAERVKGLTFKRPEVTPPVVNASNETTPPSGVAPPPIPNNPVAPVGSDNQTSPEPVEQKSSNGQSNTTGGRWANLSTRHKQILGVVGGVLILLLLLVLYGTNNKDGKNNKWASLNKEEQKQTLETLAEADKLWDEGKHKQAYDKYYRINVLFDNHLTKEQSIRVLSRKAEYELSERIAYWEKTYPAKDRTFDIYKPDRYSSVVALDAEQAIEKNYHLTFEDPKVQKVYDGVVAQKLVYMKKAGPEPSVVFFEYGDPKYSTFEMAEPVNEWFKDNLKDYDSLKDIDCERIKRYKDRWKQKVKYRSTNSYGGYTMDSHTFYIQKGKVVEVE